MTDSNDGITVLIKEHSTVSLTEPIESIFSHLGHLEKNVINTLNAVCKNATFWFRDEVLCLLQLDPFKRLAYIVCLSLGTKAEKQ